MLSHFPAALSVDDYMSRVEVALAGYGFTGDNTIGEHSRAGRYHGGSWVVQWAAGRHCTALH